MPAAVLFSSWWDRSLFVLVVIGIGWGVSALLARFVRHLFSERGWSGDLLDPLAQVSRLLLMLLPVLLVLPLLQLDPLFYDWIRHGLALICIWLLTVFAFRGVTLFRTLVLQHYDGLGDAQAAEQAAARKAQTQILMLESIFKFLILLTGLATALMTFDRIRQVGLSLLASAGIAGVVLGFAAQKFISTLIAGLQIALTQPIRIDDAVTVEGEFGWIEEITLTFVVVRLWDLRRLVVPTPTFIDKPFQNWTRTSARMLGTVFLYSDYSVPVDALRAELQQIITHHPLWNGETCALHVTDATAETLQLRVLVSADDANTLWDLRADLREKLVAWLQAHHPGALPKTRIELEPGRIQIGRMDVGRMDVERMDNPAAK